MNTKVESAAGRRLGKRTLFIGTAIATTLFAGSAFAQQAPAKGNEGLEEVVVTAQRTEQRLQDVPMSVTAITSHQLELQGVTSGEQLTAMVPNLVVGSESSNGIDTTVSIRGIPNVGLYIDGIYQPSIGFRESGIVEMDRVEILRGPQGTLFGRETLSLLRAIPAGSWIPPYTSKSAIAGPPSILLLFLRIELFRASTGLLNSIYFGNVHGH